MTLSLQYQPRYRPDIEGLRAIAVFIVVLFHAGVPGFEGGFVGVDVFFVLSGYLITWLLVNEAERKGRIDLRRFYARRVRRLLPAMAVVLLVTFAVTAFLYAPLEQRQLVTTWASASLYASNIRFARLSLDYHGTGATTNPLLHTWSLSVEEQFYLVWPWLVILGLGVAKWQRQRFALSPRRLLVVLGLMTVLSFALSLYLTAHQRNWAFYLSPMRAWEFGMGGLAVLLPIGQWPRRNLNPGRLGALAPVLSVLALLGLGAATVLFDNQTAFPGVAALLPVFSTVVLLRAGTPEDASGGINRFLSLPLLQSIGKLSYSWYLWHWPALVFAAALVEQPSAGVRFAAVAVSLLLAILSYRYVETPLRHHRALANPARSVALAVAFSVIGVAAAGLWWRATIAWSESPTQARFSRVRDDLPVIYDDDCDRFGTGELVECIYGDSTSSRTAVLIGDSHAGQWFPALHEAADESGWRLVVLTLSACPMVETPALYSRTLGRIYTECPPWREQALSKIQSLNPDVVFVGSATAYDVPIQAWLNGTHEFMAAVEERSDRAVLIVDIPFDETDVPACLARASWRPGRLLDPACTTHANALDRGRALAQILAVRDMPSVSVLNLRDAVCAEKGCTATAGDLVRYRNPGHLSREFALTFKHSFRGYLPDTRT